MKREALSHPKTLDLADRLGVSKPTAIGYLSLLWNFAADYAFSGDIGRWGDGVIARACEFPGDPAQFVVALCESGWLDRDETHRLVIHDWAQHCENWIRAKAQKAGVRLLGEARPATYDPVLRGCLKSGSETGSDPDVSAGLKMGSSHAGAYQTKPNQSHPNQTSEAPPPPAGGRRSPKQSAAKFDPLTAAIPELLDTPEFRAAWSDWCAHRVEIKKPLTETSTRQQFADLAKVGVERAAETIRVAIRGGWQGLFPDKVSAPNGHHSNGHDLFDPVSDFINGGRP